MDQSKSPITAKAGDPKPQLARGSPNGRQVLVFPAPEADGPVPDRFGQLHSPQEGLVEKEGFQTQGRRHPTTSLN
jgi:hypothetical protein